MAKEEEANTTRQNLVKGLKKNVLSTFSLTDTIGRAIKVQDQLQQTFVSVGNAQMASLGSLNKTFNNVGLSLKESLGMFGAMADNSLKMSNQGTKDAIARSIKLGKDFQTTSKIIAMNSQALGLSIESSNRMADSFLEAGATYGINSDILVKAISSNALKNFSPFRILKLNAVINTKASLTSTPIKATIPKPDSTLIGIPCNK